MICEVCTEGYAELTVDVADDAAMQAVSIQVCRACATLMFQAMVARWNQVADEQEQAVAWLCEQLGVERPAGRTASPRKVSEELGGWGVWHADDEAWIGFGATNGVAAELIPEGPDYAHLSLRPVFARITPADDEPVATCTSGGHEDVPAVGDALSEHPDENRYPYCDECLRSLDAGYDARWWDAVSGGGQESNLGTGRSPRPTGAPRQRAEPTEDGDEQPDENVQASLPPRPKVDPGQVLEVDAAPGEGGADEAHRAGSGAPSPSGEVGPRVGEPMSTYGWEPGDPDWGAPDDETSETDQDARSLAPAADDAVTSQDGEPSE